MPLTLIRRSPAHKCTYTYAHREYTYLCTYVTKCLRELQPMHTLENRTKTKAETENNDQEEDDDDEDDETVLLLEDKCRHMQAMRTTTTTATTTTATRRQ